MGDMDDLKPKINRMLKAMLGIDSLVEKWWLSPNRAFDYKTPQDLYTSSPQGKQQVYKYVLSACMR